MSITTFLIIFTVHVQFSASHTCQALDNVDVLVVDRNGDRFNKTVDGCIQRAAFDNATVVEVHVKQQKVNNLWRDTVKNVKYLKTVSFVECEVEFIWPIAFRNVPNLQNIEISQNRFKEVGVGIFTFDLIPKLESLALNNNEINYVEDNAFVNLTNLKKLYLHHNQLEVWRQEWFQNAGALEELDFRHNKVRELPRKAFMELRTLQRINFEHNDIETIQRDVFKNLRSLEYLGLAHNKLTELESNSFPNTVRIGTFTIHANYLNFISKEVLRKLAAVRIMMDYNPWKCECLENINNWLYLKNGKSIISEICTRTDVPVCAFSSKICLETVESETTQRYINLLKNLSTPLDDSCAKLKY